MHTLIIALISISLEALCLFALLSASPKWMQTAPDVARVLAAGISEMDNAFNRYAIANGGAAPAPTAASDGGLSTLFKPTYLAFAPSALQGYAWKYGKNALNAYYVCLYRTASPSAQEDLYRGMTRLQKFLPYTSYVIHTTSDTTGAGCGATPSSSVDPATAGASDTPPSSYPANINITFFLKYVPGQKPTSAVLPCSESGCLASPFL